MKKDERGKVIVDFIKRAIPHTPSGDPDFKKLGTENIPTDDRVLESYHIPGSLLDVFSEEEIVALCNRAIYQMEYQRGWHRRWERQKAEDLAPLKAKVMEMFPELRSWTKASDEQLRMAQATLNKEKKDVSE